jgi:hypothetical protein
MMDTIKNHIFEVILSAAVLVVGLAVGLGSYLVYGGQAKQVRGDLDSAIAKATRLEGSTLYSDGLVQKVADQDKQRQKEYAALILYLKSMSAESVRPPLVKNLFPRGADQLLFQQFKSAYDVKLKSFMTTLNAVKPTQTDDLIPGSTTTRSRTSDESLKAAMFADPKRSFVRPDWIELGTAPSMGQVRAAQEDLWLMDDLVSILASTNADALKQIMAKDPSATKSIGWAPVKELVEIRVGADVTAPGGKAGGTVSRYVTPVKGGSAKLGPLTRTPVPGFYNVLPYRIEVIVDARYCGEVVRRLKDHETFLTVESWQVTPILTDTALTRTKDLLALSLRDYGWREVEKDDRLETQHATVVRLQIVGTSLAWTLEGGRVLN